MKNIIHILALTLLLGFGNAAAQEAEAHATKGDELYRNVNYQGAIDEYEAALSLGKTSATLHYNLGNAYYRTGQMGLAILNYERALRLSPSMGDAKTNLVLAHSKTVDRIAEVPQLFLVRWVEWLRTGITPTAWRVITLILLALLCAAIVTLRLGRDIKLRKAGLIGGVVTLLLLVVSVVLFVASTRQFNAHDRAVVMDPAISVKSSPENASVDKMILHEGTTVDIAEQLTGWYKIRIADGTTGWCQSSSLERI